jgi:hypothetical protein
MTSKEEEPKADGRLTLELEEQTRDGGDGSADHVRRGTGKTGSDHGDVLGNVGRSCYRESRQ